MAEALPSFVARRQPSWARLEQLLAALDQKTLDLDGLGELDRLYRQASADLAHAQLSFAATDVHRFLNGLYVRAYGLIYRPRPTAGRRSGASSGSTFPPRCEASWPTFASGRRSPRWAWWSARSASRWCPAAPTCWWTRLLRAMVDDQRLWTDAAAHGRAHPAGDRDLHQQPGGHLPGVRLRAHFGVLTVLVLAWNGVHVGALTAYCFQHGVGPRLLVFMSAHGWVELSIIAICGGAGLMVGHALVDPGELPRSQVLRERGRRAVRIVLGCAPFLVLIGVVEGFVSPGTVVPAPVKVVLGPLLCAAFWLYLLRAGRNVSSRAPARPEG